jgi:hypothetical protein
MSTIIIPTKADRKRINNWVDESDIAFRQMAREIENGNGKRTYFPMISEGAYEVRHE